jgi:hypothetical protein
MERPECHGGAGMSKPYISSKLREILGRTEFLRSTAHPQQTLLQFVEIGLKVTFHGEVRSTLH